MIGDNNPTLTASVEESLAGAVCATDPFPHVLLKEFFDRETAGALLRWFATDAEWKLQESHFYLQYACANLYAGMPPQCRAALGPDALDAVRCYMERQFDVRITPTRVYVSAHKLLPGQGIGIHSDQPSGGTETHRFIVHINAGFEDAYGGHLILFRRKDMSEIAQIVRPIHNSAVGFELSAGSFHAVNDVMGGVRYSLIFSFWREGAAFQTGVYSHGKSAKPSKSAEASLGEYAKKPLAYLRALRAHDVPHSNHSLLDHLIGTAAVLQGWSCDEPVCLAGLFHSVYGTEGFKTVLVTIDEREDVAKHIGVRAERLSFLFSQMDRRSFYSHVYEKSRSRVRLYDIAEEIDIDWRDQQDIMAMIWANTVDQLYRMPVDDGELRDMRAALGRMHGILSDAAIGALEKILATDT